MGAVLYPRPMGINGWAKRLREHLKARKVTQEQLAEKLEVTQGAVAHWLSGRRDINLRDFIRLCVAADADAKTILFGVDEKTRIMRELRQLLADGEHTPRRDAFERTLGEAPKPARMKK